MRASLAALTIILSSAAARAVDAPPVTRVVLYPDSAVLTRELDVPCSGDHVIAKFANLPPGFDRDTVRASASGAGAQIEGVSLNEEVREKPYSAEVQALDNQLDALRIRQTALQRQINRAQVDVAQAQSLIQSVAPFINREAAMQGKPNTAGWAAALDQAVTSMNEANALRRTAEVEKRDVDRHLADLQQRRDALAGSTPPRAYEADVVLKCSGRAHVELSYLTRAAQWSPAYEARADEAAHTIDFTVLANVTQQTGEAWNDVAVTLSTAQSQRNAQPPTLQRLYVDASPKEETKKVLVRRDETAQHLSDGLNGAPGAADVAAADQGVSVQLKVPENADIVGDGRPSRLVVQQLAMPADFTLVTIPKLLPYVLLRGQAKNIAHYPLLSGPVSLFSRGSFIGTTQLGRIAEGDTIKLAFGVNENIQIRRSTLSEERTEPGLLSSTRRLHYGYRIELTSSAPRATALELQEQIPVSEMDDVKVIVDDKTTPGFSTVATDGLLTWPVTLKAGEKKNVELWFTVEIPTKYDSAGL